MVRGSNERVENRSQRSDKMEHKRKTSVRMRMFNNREAQESTFEGTRVGCNPCV